MARCRGRTRLRVGVAAVAGLALAQPAALTAQTAVDPELVARCQAAGLPTARQPLCEDALAGLQLLQPELGLLLAGGNPVLGTASPIGTKVGSIPRVHLTGRINFVRAELPDVLDYPDAGTRPDMRSFSVPMPQLDVSIGVFDGLGWTPTLGGLASVELLGTLSTLILPGGEGFENDVTGFGFGARIGLLRESFAAPGVSVSGMYKWFGRVQYGETVESDADFGLDLRAASFRAGLSKSFVALGLAFTLGYDRYWSDVDLRVTDSSALPEPVALAVIPESAPADLSHGRWSAHLDVSYIVLFFNLVAAAGWQEEERVVTSSGLEVESGNLFTSIGIRLSL